MDKKLLDSFNNLSIALQNLAETLADNKNDKEKSSSSIVDALKNSDLGKQLKSIDSGVKKIQEDNKKIISNQNKILGKIQTPKQANKAKEEQSIFGQTSDPNQKSKVMDSVKVVLLIAAGVLALGLAFKIIGKVDWKSVIALSLSMPLVAIAFEKISKIKTDIRQLSVSLIGLVIMSVAIVASSRVLQYTKPVGFLQLVTVIFIAAAFATMSFSLHKMASGVKKVDVKDLWKLPIVLVAASAAIVASSWILQFTKPVGFLQLITIVFIAAAFAVLSFSLHKLTTAVAKVDVKDVWKLPVVLIAASVAIALSSIVLQSVVPVSFSQMITSIFIAATFVVISYALPKIAKAIKDIGVEDTAKMSLVLVALAGAIVGASWEFQLVKPVPFMTLLNIVFQSVALTVVAIALSASIWVMNKLGINPQNAFEGGLVLVILAGAIMTSSYLLSAGNYNNFPSLEWTLSSSVSLLAFGVLAFVSSFAAAEIVVGAIGLLIISSTITASSYILGAGNYDVYPSLDWSLGVSTSMMAFGIATAALGTLILLTGGLGLLGLAAGAAGIIIIAGTIFETSKILSKGTYTGGPSFDWALGTGILLTTYGAAMGAIGLMIIGSLGIGYLGLKVGSAAVKIIAQSIVDSSLILNKGDYKGGPTKEWAEGVALSIGAFAPVFQAISDQSLIKSIFSNPATKMRDAIRIISDGIVESAIYFNKNKTSFEGGPNKEWAEGVGKSIAAFAPVYKVLNDKGFWSSGVSPEDMKSAIMTISEGIVNAGIFFSQNESAFNGSYPSEEWADGVGKAIEAFSPAFEWANNNKTWFGAGTSFLKKTILTVAESIVGVSKVLSGSTFTNNIKQGYTDELSKIYISFFDIVKKSEKINSDKLDQIYSIAYSIRDTGLILSKGNYPIIPANYMDSLSKNITSYMYLIDSLNGRESMTTFLGFTVNRTSEISRMADDYEKLSNSISSLSTSIESINLDKITALKTLTGSIVLMSLMDTDQFNNMMDALENKSKVFVDVIKELEEGVGSTEVSIGSKASAASSGPSTQDILDVMYRIEGRLGQIAASSANLSSYVNEIRGKSSKSGLKK